jgi:hypothetical protein
MAHITDNSKKPWSVERDPYLFSKIWKGYVKEGFVSFTEGMSRMEDSVAVSDGFVSFTEGMSRMEDSVAVSDLQRSADGSNLNPWHEPAVPVIQYGDPRRTDPIFLSYSLEFHQHIGHPPLRGKEKLL